MKKIAAFNMLVQLFSLITLALFFFKLSQLFSLAIQSQGGVLGVENSLVALNLITREQVFHIRNNAIYILIVGLVINLFVLIKRQKK